MRIIIDYKNFTIDTEITIKDNERLAFYGASGSGKSSILRAMAGLIKGASQPLEREQIGFMHQDCTLFEHLSVLENLQTQEHKNFAQSLKAWLFKQAGPEFYEHLLKTANLYELMHTKPAQLSGGQRQRAALCAALASKPKYLLLDEPFSALDDTNKKILIKLVRTLCDELKTTLIFISHSAAEISALAQRVYLLENGRIKGELSVEKFAEQYNKPLY